MDAGSVRLEVRAEEAHEAGSYSRCVSGGAVEGGNGASPGRYQFVARGGLVPEDPVPLEVCMIPNVTAAALVELRERTRPVGCRDGDQAKGRSSYVGGHLRYQRSLLSRLQPLVEERRHRVADRCIDDEVTVGKVGILPQCQDVGSSWRGRDVVRDRMESISEDLGLGSSDVKLGVILPHQESPGDVALVPKHQTCWPRSVR